MTAAHRLAAILAADLAGQSRLMGEDEMGLARSHATSWPFRWERGPPTRAGT